MRGFEFKEGVKNVSLGPFFILFLFCLFLLSFTYIYLFSSILFSFFLVFYWIVTMGGKMLYLGNEGIMEIMVLQGPTKTLCVHVCVLIEVENSTSVKEREEITYYHEIFLWLCICFATFLFPCDDRNLLSLLLIYSFYETFFLIILCIILKILLQSLALSLNWKAIARPHIVNY